MCIKWCGFHCAVSSGLTVMDGSATGVVPTSWELQDKHTCQWNGVHGSEQIIRPSSPTGISNISSYIGTHRTTATIKFL